MGPRTIREEHKHLLQPGFRFTTHSSFKDENFYYEILRVDEKSSGTNYLVQRFIKNKANEGPFAVSFTTIKGLLFYGYEHGTQDDIMLGGLL